MWKIKKGSHNKSPDSSVCLSPVFEEKKNANKAIKGNKRNKSINTIKASDKPQNPSLKSKEIGLPNQSNIYTINDIHDEKSKEGAYEILHNQETWLINIQGMKYRISIYVIEALYDVIYNKINNPTHSPLINPLILGEIITFKPYRKPIKKDSIKKLVPCSYIKGSPQVEEIEQTDRIINFLIDGTII